MAFSQRRLVLVRCLVLPLAVGLTAGPAAADTQDTNSFVVRNVRIFDGVRVTGTGSVLVLHGRIAGVGKVAEPPGTPAYDGRGKTVLPGLIDGHRHTIDKNNALDRRDEARFGVTTGLDMLGDPSVIAEARRQRRSLDRTDLADMWAAGWPVTVPGGTPPDFPELPPLPRLAPDADPDRFVADRVREGSDHIKLFLDDGSLYGQNVPTLSPAQTRAVIAATHRRGRLAVAHVVEQEHGKTAVHAGVDGLAHVFLDTVADDAFVRETRQRGTFVTSTLSVFDCGRGADNLLQDPRVTPYLSARQTTELKNRWPDCPLTWFQNAVESVRRLNAAGVPIVAGTDAGAIFAAHGVSLHAELAHLVSAGLTPAQALTAATATPARRYHLVDRGRIAPGLRADLMLVNGDPTTDVTAIRDIAAIWKNGYPINRQPH